MRPGVPYEETEARDAITSALRYLDAKDYRHAIAYLLHAVEELVELLPDAGKEKPHGGD